MSNVLFILQNHNFYFKCQFYNFFFIIWYKHYFCYISLWSIKIDVIVFPKKQILSKIQTNMPSKNTHIKKKFIYKNKFQFGSLQFSIHYLIKFIIYLISSSINIFVIYYLCKNKKKNVNKIRLTIRLDKQEDLYLICFAFFILCMFFTLMYDSHSMSR